MTTAKRVPKIFSTSSTTETISIYLSDGIDAPEYYTEEMQVLKEAKEGDTIYIYINNGGGYVRTGLQLVENIRNSKATVIGCIEVECHSAATYIFLACDSWEVSDNAFMLIHNYTSGAYGKGNDLVQNVVETDKWLWESMKNIYIPFLTEAELASVATQDIYLHAKDIRARLDNVADERELNRELAKEEQLAEEMKLILELIANEKQNSEGMESLSSE
jgi:ATP-dependent protease ClpP protease subunit